MKIIKLTQSRHFPDDIYINIDKIEIIYKTIKRDINCNRVEISCIKLCDGSIIEVKEELISIINMIESN